ncbi:hypothetical protein HDU96_000747 [Phlyctochytrium bullatum]|nr:hypothetical protein HDU96_000747 [Phlyctochytrium bullatum]
MAISGSPESLPGDIWHRLPIELVEEILLWLPPAVCSPLLVSSKFSPRQSSLLALRNTLRNLHQPLSAPTSEAYWPSYLLLEGCSHRSLSILLRSLKDSASSVNSRHRIISALGSALDLLPFSSPSLPVKLLTTRSLSSLTRFVCSSDDGLPVLHLLLSRLSLLRRRNPFLRSRSHRTTPLPPESQYATALLQAALSQATLHTAPSTCRLLLTHTPFDPRHSDHLALRQAAYHNRTDVLRLLLTSQSYTGSLPTSPVVAAAKSALANGHLDAAEMLLPLTPPALLPECLVVAIRSGTPGVVALVLDRVASVGAVVGALERAVDAACVGGRAASEHDGVKESPVRVLASWTRNWLAARRAGRIPSFPPSSATPNLTRPRSASFSPVSTRQAGGFGTRRFSLAGSTGTGAGLQREAGIVRTSERRASAVECM